MIDAKRVNEIFLDCLFRDDEPKDNPVIVDGIVRGFGFHPQRLSSYRQEIFDLLSELPETFRESVGGGWTFLNVCMDKDGNHWAEHPTAEQLVALGVALKLVEYQLPREMWKVLPGGVPYLVFKDKTN